ncbi:hypothetical protein [Cetobacterium sp.]|uniref:hypothetical protein n=1 Tax=Cetobacterium sp. TaxID=2071632 RepID=UPI003F309F9F
MKKLGLYICLNLFVSTMVLANEIPNTLILDNPDRPITTTETIKKREKAELNLNIKKVTSYEIDGYVNRAKKLISFPLDSIESDDAFYLTSDKSIFNENTRELKEISQTYELEKINFLEKAVTFKYTTLSNELFLVNYSNSTKKLKKLYRWQQKYAKYIDEKKGDILISFTEEYKPFEIINFSTIDKNMKTKGKINVREGEYIKIDSLATSEVIVKDLKGEVLGNITLKNGSGILKLDDSKKGVILQDGSSLLNFGIGFRNGELLLQVKGTTDSAKEYSLALEIKNLDETISFYKLNIKPAQYGLKILSNNLTLDFANSPKVLSDEEKLSDELTSVGEISIDSKGLDIKVNFINNGSIKLKNGENTINAKLEGTLVTEGDLKTKVVKVLGRVKKEDTLNMPDGEYVGSTELVITVDS